MPTGIFDRTDSIAYIWPFPFNAPGGWIGRNESCHRSGKGLSRSRNDLFIHSFIPTFIHSASVIADNPYWLRILQLSCSVLGTEDTEVRDPSSVFRRLQFGEEERGRRDWDPA